MISGCIGLVKKYHEQGANIHKRDMILPLDKDEYQGGGCIGEKEVILHCKRLEMTYSPIPLQYSQKYRCSQSKYVNFMEKFDGTRGRSASHIFLLDLFCALIFGES